jgi:hypothetical protein
LARLSTRRWETTTLKAPSDTQADRRAQCTAFNYPSLK